MVGGGGALNKVFNTGRLHSKVSPLTLLCIIKLRASIHEWYPFHIPNLKHCIILFEYIIMNQSVNCEVFVSFKYNLEMHLLVFKVFKI